MKIKLTTFLFGLLLAVGWTSHASAQALPQGGYAERLGLNDVTATMSVKDLVKAQKKKVASFQTMPMSTEVSTQESTPMMAPKRATGVSSVVKNKAYYQQYKYNWTDDETGETHTNVDPTEPATNAYQIYELLRFVYGNPNFPGPTYSAYTPNYQREDEVYYGAINGGWDITAGSGGAAMITHDITITASSYYASFKSITVYDMDGNVLTSWDAQTAIDNGEYTTYTATDGTRYRYTMPGWSSDYYMGILNAGTESNIIYVGYLASGTTTPGTITIPYSLLNGQTQVRVVINANHDYEEGDEGDANQTITVNGEEKALGVDFADFTWTPTVAEQPEQGAFVQGTVVPPYEDGYTVVVVALKDRKAKEEGDVVTWHLEDEIYPASSTHFEQKSQLITYFKNNIEYVILLTDGLRIGSEADHTSGTVFNCDGRLNRFFFLGKGKARKKAPRILDFISRGTVYFASFTAENNQSYSGNIRYYDWFGEDVPFEEMFEQFSPTSTTVSDESQTTDLFDKLREGNVYDVQHDCGSVMQAEHEFSLSGKDGTEHYPFSGLNFFCPDYRLLFWPNTFNSYTVDGRDNVPYESANTNYTTPEGSHGSYFSGVSDDDSGYNSATWYSAWSAYYAVYNTTHAPKVGIYRITLDATATQTGTTHNPDNLNFDVTLTWVSSLDQMSGHTVPQIYTVYLVDENGNRSLLEPESVKFYDIDGNELTGDYSNNPFVITQVVYKVPQNEHSYTLEYQVDGVAQEGPGFHATSNKASVVIPGWNDFVGLKLDHHESDFDPEFEGNRVNFYRNFLAMVNEDIYNGLTISKITGYNEADPSTPLEKMDKFNLYRFLPDAQGNPTTETKVATITFDQATADQVHFNVVYENQEVENYTLTYKENNQTYTVNNAYSHENLEIPTSGWVRVKGNGDIVIWPNRYSVNLKSITVKNGNTTITSWNASSANVATQNPNLPTTPYKWDVSPGSKFLPYTTSTGNEKVCYMEGGGYLYIPGVLKTYSNATVVIEAFGEAGNVNRISVNDASKDINATAGGTTYTWPTGDNSLSPNAAPRQNTNCTAKVGHLKKSATTTNWSNESTPRAQAPRREGTRETKTWSWVGATDGTTLPTGWTLTDPTYSSLNSNGDGTWYIGVDPDNATAQSITIPASVFTGCSTVQVVIRAKIDTGYSGKSISVNGVSKALNNTLNDYTWENVSTSNGVLIEPTDGYVGFASIVITGETEPVDPSDGKIYELVTDPATQLIDGKKYIIVSGDYAMGALSGTTGYGTCVNITNNGNTVLVPSNVTPLVLTLHDYTNTYNNAYKYAFSVPNGTYLMAAGASSNSNLTTSATAIDNASWRAIADSKSTGGYGIQCYRTTTRAIGYQVSGTRFANYATSNMTASTTSYYYGLLYVEKEEDTPQPGIEGGLLRLHVLFADQLKEVIPEDNSHPDAYGYVLRYEPEGGETKESGKVRVNIQKTDCEVMGYHTLGQIDRDTDRKLAMDVLTADVEYNLTSTNDMLNYYYLQGAKDRAPELGEDYLSQLYRQEDFTYREMLEGSPEFDHVVNSGEHHYFNSTDEPIIGQYNNAAKYVTYAPSVSTWGIQRRYFELDGKDNTYGGPIWKTAVGKAQMGLNPEDPDDPAYKPIVEFQEGWNTSWTVDGQGSNLYMLDNINALGYLPPKELTKVEFEPYMFRVFVESDHGKLRPFKYVKDDKGNDVITADEEGSTTGPTCVWSGYIKRDGDGKIINDPANGVTVDSIGTYGPYTYTKNKVNRANPDDTWTLDENNAIFGALDDLLEITGYDAQGKPIYKDIPEEDLRIFVRFYFSVKGEAADHTIWTRSEGSRSGNGAESDGSAAGGVATSVKELQYHGDAVETIYYNIQGMTSDKPFDGVNVVVTRYSDGATSVSKVVR